MKMTHFSRFGVESETNRNEKRANLEKSGDLGKYDKFFSAKSCQIRAKRFYFSSFGLGRSRTRTENLSNPRKKILFSSFARKEEEPGHGSCQHKDIKDESIRFVTDGLLW